MIRHPHQLLPATLLGILAGCSTSGHSSPSGSSPPSNASITLDGDALGSASTDLLDAMRGRVRGMQVRESGGDCPLITFRGARSLMGENGPAVYVDGVRATNTCILNTLQTSEVDRIEAYLSGVAPRPPYQAHPNGLIIVFMQNGRPG